MANATALSLWKLWMLLKAASLSVASSARFTMLKPPTTPLCIHRYRPHWKGWQFCSLTGMPG
jgi:hypothetical protein